MANPKLIITYQDPNAKALCRAVYFGADHEAGPNTIVVEKFGKNATGEEGFHDIGHTSRMPIEIVAMHGAAALGRGDAKATVDKKTGTVHIDASKVDFPI